MRSIIFIAVLALAACAAASQPPEAQLATVCNGIAAAYNTAAAYVAQGKLSGPVVLQLAAIEPEAEAVCNTTSPPLDLTTAIAQAQSYLNQITLANAGVK